MKRISLFVCTLVLVVTGAQAQTPVRSELLPWKMYTIEDADFSVALPTLPAMHTTQEFIARVRRNGRIRQLGAYADGVVYAIYIYENPGPRKSLGEFVREHTSNLVSDQVSERDLTVNGFAGKAVSFTYRGTAGVSHFYAAEDRLYKFTAIGATEDDGRVNKFFSALSLRKDKDSVEVSDGQGVPYEPKVESGAAGLSTGENLFLGKEVDRKVILGMKPEPLYTDSARQNHVTGTVVLKCVFAANGNVTNIRIVSGLPYGLTEKAIDAAKKIKFIPAVKDGKYASMWIQLEYNFNLY